VRGHSDELVPCVMYIHCLLLGVVTLMCISQDLRCIWPNKVYVYRVCDHTRSSRVEYMSSMPVYVEYVVILILHTTFFWKR